MLPRLLCRCRERACQPTVERAADVRPEGEVFAVADCQRGGGARVRVLRCIQVMAREMAEGGPDLFVALRGTARCFVVVGGFGDAKRCRAGAR